MTPSEERLKREQSQRKQTEATHDDYKTVNGVEPKKRTERSEETGRKGRERESEGMEIEGLRLQKKS